ncbi:MAG: hypothetical protein AAF914_15215 [Pseudomonadota bacterium]
MLVVLCLAACGAPPAELEDRVSAEARAAAAPDIQPLDPLLAAADALQPDDPDAAAQALLARARALEIAAANLQTEPVD